MSERPRQLPKKPLLPPLENPDALTEALGKMGISDPIPLAPSITKGSPQGSGFFFGEEKHGAIAIAAQAGARAAADAGALPVAGPAVQLVPYAAPAIPAIAVEACAPSAAGFAFGIRPSAKPGMLAEAGKPRATGLAARHSARFKPGGSHTKAIKRAATPIAHAGAGEASEPPAAEGGASKRVRNDDAWTGFIRADDRDKGLGR